MHATTLRRLLVLGVCVVGVGCLHLAAGGGRAPHQTSGSRSPARPSPPVAATALTDASVRTGPLPSVTRRATTPADEQRQRVRPSRGASAASDRVPARGGTPFDPAGPEDEVAPAPVTRLTTGAATPERLTLRWPAASDNVGVVSYQVLLDGYEVATTPLTSATVPWFNDGARNHVVQVRAMDAAGNQSAASPTLLVERPGLSPSATSTPSAEPEPTSSATPFPPWTDDQPTAPSDQAEEPPVSRSSTSRPSSAVGAR